MSALGRHHQRGTVLPRYEALQGTRRRGDARPPDLIASGIDIRQRSFVEIGARREQDSRGLDIPLLAGKEQRCESALERA